MCILFLIFIASFVMRWVITDAFVTNYMVNLNANSAQNDIMQASELAYDFSLLLRATISGRIVTDVQYIRSLAEYFNQYVLNHTYSNHI
jgi:hypothetical protein